MNRRLVLLRHGQTSWNVAGRLQGHRDVELDETGHDQAASVAPRVAMLEPVALWSSDLSRAMQTAAYLAKECELEPRADPRFREADLGEAAGILKADYAHDNPELFAALMAGDFGRIAGAEDFAAIRERFGAGLQDVLADLGQGQTAVVVTHGSALKAGICHALDWPAGAAASLAGQGNCHWAVLTEIGDTGRFRLAGYDVGA